MVLSLDTQSGHWYTEPRACFSICWCWLRIANRFTCTGIGTTILGLFIPSGTGRPWTRPAFTLFHFARRFWNQIFTWTSLSFNECAICDRSVNDKYFLLWNSFSSSSNCSEVKAVLRRLVFADVTVFTISSSLRHCTSRKSLWLVTVVSSRDLGDMTSLVIRCAKWSLSSVFAQWSLLKSQGSPWPADKKWAILTLIPPITTFHKFVVCSLVCLCSRVAYFANDIDSDQTALRSSLIRFHSVCFHDKIYHEVHFSLCSRRTMQTTFQDKNIGGKRVRNKSIWNTTTTDHMAPSI